MPSPSVPHPQELPHAGAGPHCHGGSAQAGHWQLACGHAMGLQPRQDGLLAIGQGAVWLTVSGPGACAVDQFLGEGDTFVIAAGQHAVIEPWVGRGRAPEAVAFTWAETGAGARSLGRSGAGAGTVRSACIACASSLREALHAQAEVGRALLGLARAVLAWGRGGRVATPSLVGIDAASASNRHTLRIDAKAAWIAQLLFIGRGGHPRSTMAEKPGLTRGSR